MQLCLFLARVVILAFYCLEGVLRLKLLDGDVLIALLRGKIQVFVVLICVLLVIAVDCAFRCSFILQGGRKRLFFTFKNWKVGLEIQQIKIELE